MGGRSAVSPKCDHSVPIRGLREWAQTRRSCLILPPGIGMKGAERLPWLPQATRSAFHTQGRGTLPLVRDVPLRRPCATFNPSVCNATTGFYWAFVPKSLGAADLCCEEGYGLSPLGDRDVDRTGPGAVSLDRARGAARGVCRACALLYRPSYKTCHFLVFCPMSARLPIPAHPCLSSLFPCPICLSFLPSTWG